MATPTLTKHSVPGTLGPLLIDVRAGGRALPRPAVVILHGFKGFKDWGMFPPLSERMARAGLTAVSPNFSGSGVDDSGDFSLPELFGHNTFTAELQDSQSILDALLNGQLGIPGPSSVGLLGHSRGGGIAILQTARDRRVSALVTWAAISNVQRWSSSERAAWRSEGKTEVRNARTGQILPLYTDVLDDIEQNAATLDIQAAAGRIQVPWLLVHGSQDESVNYREAALLHRASSQEAARILRVENAGHTFGAVHPWRSTTLELDLVFDQTLEWFAANLK